jgi:multiple sugar transport system substrate-binding protein
MRPIGWHAALLGGAALLAASSSLGAQELRFWTTEEQPERLAVQEEIAADFKAATGSSYPRL